jgi:spore coat polysaccharide biosynthesis protein SpsF
MEVKMQTPKKQCETGSEKVMAFLQARMGSTRLPGKVLMRLQGKSILERAVSRLRAAPDVNEVAVLTTCLHEDDCIVEHARNLGVQVHRGPGQDVLRRFQEAAEKFNPGIIVRATADNPLIEISSIARIVFALRSGNLDYCMEGDLPYGAATEVCTASALERTHQAARDPRYREHVTLHMKEHPAEFRVAYLRAPESLRYPRLRITVDTPEDLAFMDHLLSRVPEGNGPVPLKDYIPFALTMFQERECKA